jgi:hypothetical protein
LGYLLERFLRRYKEATPAGRRRAGKHLQQQRGLAYPRLAGKKRD